MRADDLTVQMVRAALAKVPELDPTQITDLLLGCGMPGGEQGFNMGRNIAVMLGYDHLPGTRTVLVAGGAGAVGHYAIELAKHAGARVVATVSSDEKRALAEDAGADLIVRYTVIPYPLEQVADAQDNVAQGAVGKVVLRIAEK